MKKHQHLPVAVFLLIFSTVFLTYQPGLVGSFLLDDFPNLELMGHLGGIVDWETFHAFVFSGFSGPTGRPIALASFLLDDNTWPSYAPWFKQTNLYIHLLCGLLLCWTILLLMRNFKHLSEQQAQWVAILACALWLLHPYMVSTTLYVVQRMAQLATLFSLMGIVIYLYGRLQIPHKTRRAYLLMTLGIGAGTVLATFSKENGALLPLLILVIEFCLPKDHNKPIWQWRAFCLWLPSIAIAVLMARYINLSEDPWSSRNFNQIERLLTETRIVCEYLLHLFVPRIEGNGLYQDGYIISKSIFEPISTLFALSALIVLFLGAFLVRKKAPVITIALLFFFAAHLMESTVVGLELYFEHRNYLAALFLFLPIAYYSVLFFEKQKTILFAVVTMLLILSGMTYFRASLWSDQQNLEKYWMQSAINSPRAINSRVDIFIRNQQYTKAVNHLEQEAERLPHSSLLTARLLLMKINFNIASEKDFNTAAQRLKQQKIDAQAIKGISTIIETIVSDKKTEYVSHAFQLLKTMQENPKHNRLPIFNRVNAYLKAKLYLYLNDEENSFIYYSEAIKRYNKTDAALAMVAEIATAGYETKALLLLHQAKSIFEKQPDRKLKRPRNTYEDEFIYLEKTLNKSITDKEPLK
jgi:tetratricopeptide (TPR) repeat protein